MILQEKYRDIIAVAFLVVAILAIYQKTLLNDFVYDDIFSILGNRAIITTLNPFYYIFHPIAGGGISADTYRPLEYLFFALEAKIFGLNPVSFHLINILLHAINTALLYLLLRNIVKNYWFAFFGALLWGLHPANTEAVVWATQQGGLFAMFFILLALLFACEVKNRLLSLFLLAFFAMLSKEHAVILPLLYCVIIFLKHQSDSWRSVVSTYKSQLIALLIPMIIALILRGIFLGSFSQQEPWGGGRYHIALTMIKAALYYVRLALWPHPLSVNYDAFPIGLSFFNLDVFASFLILTIIAIVAIAVRHKIPLFFWGSAWFALALFPVSNVFFPTKQILNERFLYFALPGFIITTIGIIQFTKDVSLKYWKIIRAALVSCAILIIPTLGYVSWMRIGDWQTEFSLWKHEIVVSQNSRRTLINYAFALERVNDTAGALPYYRRALFQFPDPQFQLRTVHHFGEALLRISNTKAARIFTQSALEKYPDDSGILFILGKIELEEGNNKGAVAIFENLARVNNETERIYSFYFALANLRNDNENEMLATIRTPYNQLSQDQIEALVYAKNAMMNKKWNEALHFFNQASSMNAVFPFLESYLWRAQTYEQLGQFENAKQDYQYILYLDPVSIDAAQGIQRINNPR